MSDLISRSELKSHIEREYRKWGEDYDAEQILCDIEDFPTAYDIDKVVEELEKLKDKGSVTKTEMLITKACVDKAIEIVKHVGVTDDVCEWKSDCHLENDNPAEWLICPHKPKRIFSKDIKYCPYCGKKIKVVE